MSNNNQTRQQFLLTFFDKKDPHGEKEVNGFILVKYPVNGNPDNSQVAIYTKQSFSKYKEYIQVKSHMQSIKQQSLVDGD
ncbi:MAG: hypothetical protein AABY22_32365 [Nanoarchaeota archaeon]